MGSAGIGRKTYFQVEQPNFKKSISIAYTAFIGFRWREKKSEAKETTRNTGGRCESSGRFASDGLEGAERLDVPRESGAS